MKHPILVAEERKVLGKKVKKLRREGLLPANVYGKNLASVALQVKLTDFQHVYKEVGGTGLVDLQVNGKAKPVLIKNLQVNHHSRTLLHADFYQVNLKEKIKSMIPVELTGEPKAVAEKLGLLLQTMSEIEVEALPDNLPEKFEVSVDHLAAVNDQIAVSDLQTGEGVTILTDPTQIVAKITELPAAEPEPEPEAAATEGEAAPAEAAEAPAAAENAEADKAE